MVDAVVRNPVKLLLVVAHAIAGAAVEEIFEDPIRAAAPPARRELSHAATLCDPSGTSCGSGNAWRSDGFCSDGGPGAEHTNCALGADCVDCGPRDCADTIGPTTITFSSGASAWCTQLTGNCQHSSLGATIRAQCPVSCASVTGCTAPPGVGGPAADVCVTNPAGIPGYSNSWCGYQNNAGAWISSLSDGYCDDGGPGAEYTDCYVGFDCADCGPRTCADTVNTKINGGKTIKTAFMGTPV